VEIIEGRAATVGTFDVRRVLPRRTRRTVGAWCFADHMGPALVTAEAGLDIGPHPHIGLQTVTWLVTGEVLHRDSLGSEQVIRPGQLNLMTAGHGVSHSEEATGTYAGAVHGIQLWVAQPADTRDGEAAFEHHAELPRTAIAGGDATVLVGSFGGVTSPARRDTDHVGVELVLARGRSSLPLDPRFEHGLVVIEGRLSLGTHVLETGHLAYVGLGRDHLDIEATEPTRALLIGGEPFPEPLLMWWNYVARTRDEVAEAHRSWVADDGRFGRVASSLGRIVTDPPPWAPGRG
jgi:redox-sensitive bicupin YhaK (pirin superfamily)